MKTNSIKSFIYKLNNNFINNSQFLKLDYINTPIGTMIAIADQQYLYVLDFINRYNLEREIEPLKIKMESSIELGPNSIIELISKELKQYFSDKLSKFTTPVYFMGTDFQKEVWQQLQQMPFGETCSYKDLANSINKPKHFRAVAKANSTNKLAIIIPCHRIINSNGNLGGYSGGLERKQWLINHESKTKK